jgi:hypothetical protein
MSDIDDCRQSVERLTRDRGEVMRAGNDKTLLAEVERPRAVYVLIATESAGIVEGYSIFEDKIVGCYTSYVAADMSGENIWYVNWRIEEHEIIDDVLVGKGLPR